MGNVIKKQNASLVKIVSMLSAGGYQDGTSLGEELSMSRSAVWKMIKKLEAYDIKIHSIKGKGYALQESLILLDAVKIKKTIANDDVDVVVLESVDSTNHYLKSYKSSKSIKVCLAEQQSQGKGRLNRAWHSPFGKNIYLSYCYRIQKDISELSGLSLVISLAVLKTLRQFGISPGLFVKWPNDIFFDHKKLSGSLIEIQAETHGTAQVVIGIGLNVNMQTDDQRISQPWISMQQILQHSLDRNELSARLIQDVLEYLLKFSQKGFTVFVDEWNRTDCLTHETITVHSGNEKITGKAIGVNDQGHLLLQLGEGKIRAFSSGDTSILKK